MNTAPAPPADWSTFTNLPCQTVGFADAMATMGYRPVYLWEGGQGALALVRGAFPGLRRLTARANVFLGDVQPEFVMAVLRALASSGIPYAKVGDTMWGPRWDEIPAGWPFRRTRLIPRHTFVLDLEQSEGALLKAMDGAQRKIRKAEREGVTVRRVETAQDLAAFYRLSKQTADRVRARSAYTDFPEAFFAALHRLLSPGGTARFYIGWYNDRPLAGCLFLCASDTVLYYLGGSTRDRELTAKQAPAAVFWHAIRDAQALGFRRFDFGGCTATEQRDDPRYGVYAFKKGWGGNLEGFANLEVVMEAPQYYVQERVLSPLWDRVHPLYFKLMELRRRVTQ
jgi:hypothetical protein